MKKYQLPLLVIVILIFLVLAFILNLKEEVVAEHYPTFSESPSPSESYIYVDIKGEVKKPGVYKVLNHTRLFQLITLAGGFTDLANQNEVNLSQTLLDEATIYVPSLTSEDEENQDQNQTLISVSKADKETLMTLPNIGEQTALKIIAYRNEHGAFKTIDELLNVKGIGEATLESIKPFITP
ncbi:MAG: helix-hairpin-helix domain-containing protein [Candidatus Izemoplasmataceae bacterium]